jgi:thymidylate synthase
MREVIDALVGHGHACTARRGPMKELTGVVLVLENPRARLSRTETRGRPISALGEFCWYLAGSDDLTSIEYYVPRYRDEAADGGVLPGAYGPRLVGARDGNQLNRILDLLNDYPTSRKAVIRLFDANDLAAGQKDVPCTCTLQYFVRNGRLDAVTYMRSNDAFLGLPHDVFCFTLLQEWIACRLSVDLGTYKHLVGSCHLYDADERESALFLGEGFQSTQLTAMPPMPPNAAEQSLATLLDAESVLRASPVEWDRIDALIASVEPFWADLIRLLSVWRHVKDARAAGDPKSSAISKLKSEMSSVIYHPFIDRQLGRLPHVR